MTDDVETIETLEIPDLLEQRDALAAELEEYDAEIRRRLLDELRAEIPLRTGGAAAAADSAAAAGSELRRRLGIDDSDWHLFG